MLKQFLAVKFLKIFVKFPITLSHFPCYLKSRKINILKKQGRSEKIWGIRKILKQFLAFNVSKKLIFWKNRDDQKKFWGIRKMIKQFLALKFLKIFVKFSIIFLRKLLRAFEISAKSATSIEEVEQMGRMKCYFKR